jgi:glycerol-3-phosphate dehydrogenase
MTMQAPGLRPDPRELRTRRFDLLVIGGGIHGCGIARDAALRGLRVALIERDDFGEGTSSRSSKLVHGGLRYLEQMHLRLVRESLRERAILLQIAPHLVRRLPFLLPIYQGARHGKLKVALGLTLYDLLAGRGMLQRHRVLSAQQALALEPRLNPHGLAGAALFHDAQMNDARLVLENALDARAHGAEVWSRVEAAELLQDQGRVAGAALRDRLTGERFELLATLTVNAAGPWYADVLARQQLTAHTPLRLSRGTHIVVPAVTHGHALLLTALRDGRVFFVLPWKGKSLVGTTDVEVDTPERGHEPSEDEISYLLDELQLALDGDAPRRADVLCAFAGVRALPPGPQSEVGDLSRAALVREEAPGLLGVLGGKYTTYRAVAERAVDHAVRLLGLSGGRVCTTALRQLPGGRIADMNDYFAVAEETLTREYQLPVEVLRYLVGTYGSRHTEVLKVIREDPAYGEPLEDGLPFTRGEIIHAVRHELALTPDDVLWRRTWRAHVGDVGEVARRRWEDAVQAAMAAVQR